MHPQEDEKEKWRIREISVNPFDFVPAFGEAEGSDRPPHDSTWMPAWSFAHPTFAVYRRPMWNRAPETNYEALMQTPPGRDPETSRDARLELLRIIHDALETLDAREVAIFDAWTYQRLSIRKIAALMGTSKSSMHRELTSIRNRLQAILDTHPTVRLHLEHHDT